MEKAPPAAWSWMSDIKSVAACRQYSSRRFLEPEPTTANLIRETHTEDNTHSCNHTIHHASKIGYKKKCLLQSTVVRVSNLSRDASVICNLLPDTICYYVVNCFVLVCLFK